MKVGIVDEHQQPLVNRYVVDHQTHMVNYPKTILFLGEDVLGEMPGTLRNAGHILYWFQGNYMLE